MFTATYFRHSAAPREIVVATTPYCLMVGLVKGPDSGVAFVCTQDDSATICSKREGLVIGMWYCTASFDSWYAIHQSCSRTRRMVWQGEVDVV
jgi:hypothetical protein